jgi:hypothetical protein
MFALVSFLTVFEGFRSNRYDGILSRGAAIEAYLIHCSSGNGE